jgi:TPP-dependent pyruvate/acetoin dehydrogenase alpha subunit
MPETVLERRRTPRMMLSREGKILDPTAMQALGLSADDILTMYRHMLLTRLFCDAANASAHRGQMPLFISSKGQEAAEVASASALATDDWIFWYLRTWGAALTRGITSATLFKWLYGIEDQQVVAHLLACHSMLPYILVGNHLPHAVGFAASRVMHREDVVVMAYFGDGATSTADFHGAANFAAIHHLPIVFFCHNNGVAVSTPLACQTAVSTRKRGPMAFRVSSWMVETLLRCMTQPKKPYGEREKPEARRSLRLSWTVSTRIPQPLEWISAPRKR